MSPTLTGPTARRLLRAWDRQQEGFHRAREARFTAMFDVVEAELPRRFHALDLGCGPGSLSLRLLRRFPRADVVAVDRDPVGLAIGSAAIGRQGGRLTWVDADLGAPGWTDLLPRARFDAALSTTALHWLRPARLRQLYRDLYGRLGPGGVLLNGDHLTWPSGDPTITRLAQRVHRVRVRRAPAQDPRTSWQDWWRRAEATPGLEAAFVERRRRFSSYHPRQETADLAFHERALHDAGFRHVYVVWQQFENRVLLAIR